MPKLYDPSQAGESGVFVKTAKIKDIEVNADSTFPKDMDYIITLEMENKEGEPYEKMMFFSANVWQKDDPAKAQFPPSVSALFRAVGVDTLPDVMNSFYAHDDMELVKEHFVGKEIKVLSYVSGTYDSNGEERPNYRFWTGNNIDPRIKVNIFDIRSEDSDIIAAFMKTVKSSKYPPKFTPEVLQNKTENAATPDPVEDPEDII